MKTYKIVLIVVAVFIGLFVIKTCNFFTRDAVDVAKEEFSPSAMLEKYEWFKNASAELDKKEKDIEVYQANINQMVEDYEDVKRKDWDRTDKEQLNQWRIELAGIKASYNSLVAEYNAQSSKFNWQKFEGEIPKEYKKFIDN